MCFSSPNLPTPQAPPRQVYAEDNTAALAAMERERAANRAKGRRATLLTSSAGVGGPAPTTSKTLLGA